MPVVKNAEAREIPWRPGYRNFVLAGEAEGVSVSSSLGVLEQGAGAPLHFHEEVDEVIVVLEGTLVTDKDLGAGYKYDAIVENARIISE